MNIEDVADRQALLDLLATYKRMIERQAKVISQYEAIIAKETEQDKNVPTSPCEKNTVDDSAPHPITYPWSVPYNPWIGPTPRYPGEVRWESTTIVLPTKTL